MEEFSQTRDSCAYVTISRELDRFAAATDTKVEELKRQKVGLIHCGDNVDVRKKLRHEGDGKSVYDIHMYNNLVYNPRIPTAHLSQSFPKVDVENVEPESLLLDAAHETKLRSLFTKHVAKVWSKDSTLCDEVKGKYDMSLLHDRSAAMTEISEKVRP